MILGSFLARTAAELALRAAGRTEAQPEHDVGDALDLTWLPTDVRPQGPDRQVRYVTSIVMHVTGVRGGYGVSKQLRKEWLKRMEAGLVVMPEDARAVLQTQAGDDDARLLGLWDRYRRTVEYHRLVSHVGQQYRLHDLRVRTPHGGPHGNGGVGFSIDQHPSEPCDGARAANAIDLLIETAQEIVDAGHPGPVPLTAHRCLAPPRYRANDPGANAWRAVAMPALAAAPHLLTVNYESKKGEGRPIPTSWDPGALYDAKGRRA